MAELDQKQIADFETQLRERQQVLWDDISRTLKKEGHPNLTEMPNDVHDSGEESVADMFADLDVATVANEAAELKDIELALLRIRSGTFGQCIDCGADVGLERLKAYPMAGRCIDCQTRHEDNRSERDSTPSL